MTNDSFSSSETVSQWLDVLPSSIFFGEAICDNNNNTNNDGDWTCYPIAYARHGSKTHHPNQFLHDDVLEDEELLRKRRRLTENIFSFPEGPPLFLSPPTMDPSDERSIISSASRNTSAPSTTTSTFNDRPILKPVPPSSSRTRSPSPTRSRNLLIKLKHGFPTLHAMQPDASISRPVAVKELLATLMKDVQKGSIPRGLKEHIRKADPDQFDEMQHLFDHQTGEPHHDPAYLQQWKVVDEIYLDAQECYNQHQDENAWVAVVQQVLEAAHLKRRHGMLRYLNVANHSTNKHLVPSHLTETFAKKTGFALAINKQNPSVNKVLHAVQTAHPDITLSQSSEPYTRTIPLVCGIEVKRPGGDYFEAIAQLGIWSAAGLERVRSLREERFGDEDGFFTLLPFVGWTVVGHDWQLHIIWKDSVGNVTMMGPWKLLSASTRTHADVFLLLALLGRVTEWIEQVYWPWLCRNMLIPLSVGGVEIGEET